MGNQHSAAHAALKPRKNVHWKSAGRPAPPGKPEILPVPTDEEPNAVTLRWTPPVHDGGAPLHGYQVECNRLGAAGWLKTTPPVVEHPELLLTGLEPPHRYQFRVAALNATGRSDYGELSDVLTVNAGAACPPAFQLHLHDVIALENESAEFRVSFAGSPPPTIAWFKDGYEIFSSRRTAITTTENTSVLIFHQTLSGDEGEVRCTATNRLGHAVSKAHLCLEAAPRLRYPRQYEDGLLYEVDETVCLKTSVVGKPVPTVEWMHDGRPISTDDRVQVTTTSKFTMLKIQRARRSDRGEYQVQARNDIGEDSAAFLVTVTAPPEPPRNVVVMRQLDKSVGLSWEPPEDDGGCRVGNYVVEYFRSGWNVWLKATTSCKTNVTLFDLIEGSEYRFRVKAESPYGMSIPSVESGPVRIPGRAADLQCLEVEARIISEALLREDGDRCSVKLATEDFPALSPPAAPERSSLSPAPRRRRQQQMPVLEHDNSPMRSMPALHPDSITSLGDKVEKRKSFQLDLEEALCPPPISLSAPELSARCAMPFKALRNSVSSTELLHERAMARFYKAVAMEEEQNATRERESRNRLENTDDDNNIPKIKIFTNENLNVHEKDIEPSPPGLTTKAPTIMIRSDSTETKEYNYNSRQTSQDSETVENKWQNLSFEEDYTASTISSEAEESDRGSLNGDIDRSNQYSIDEDTYNPRGKPIHPSPVREVEDENDDEYDNTKPSPLPDPNFVPKPILKRREPEVIEIIEEKPKKPVKSTIFKKFTKMPIQKPFSFPKLLQKKDNPILPEVEESEDPAPTQKEEKKPKDVHEVKDDGGKTIIDYYGNIVKEFGSTKKPATTLYLNTEDLKSVAKKQQKDSKKVTKTNIKKKENTTNIQKPVANHKNKCNANSLSKAEKKSSIIKDKPKVLKSNQPVSKNTSEKHGDKGTQQIVLKTTERATLIIPIDYEELEQQANANVRSAIDYIVDTCLLLLAFWVYLFKDERLAIPFLLLVIHRQLQDTVFVNVPGWIARHTPNWLKPKKS